MKKYFALVFAILFAVSCSDSKEEAAGPDLRGDATALVGTWHSTVSAEALYVDGEKDNSVSGISKLDWLVLEFSDDNTFYWGEWEDEMGTGTYTYNKVDDSLSLDFESGSYTDYFFRPGSTVTVKKLVAKSMVLREERNNSDGKWINELTFRKVK